MITWALIEADCNYGNNIKPGSYVCKSNRGPGIIDLPFGIMWTVPITHIHECAIRDRKSPYVLTAEEIREYILEYYDL